MCLKGDCLATLSQLAESLAAEQSIGSHTGNSLFSVRKLRASPAIASTNLLRVLDHCILQQR